MDWILRAESPEIKGAQEQEIHINCPMQYSAKCAVILPVSIATMAETVVIVAERSSGAPLKLNLKGRI